MLKFAPMCRPKDLPGWMTVTAAGLGGLAYWITIYPLDQIKSAMMTDSINPSERKYPTQAIAARVCLHVFLCPPKFFSEG